MFRFEKLSQRPADFRRLTGVSLKEFAALQEKVQPVWERLRRKRFDRPDRKRAPGAGRRTKLGIFENELLLLLLFYRLYPTVFVLGLMVGLDGSNVCRHLWVMEKALAKARVSWLKKPQGRKKIRSLKELSEKYPEIADLIGDATEQPVQRPKQKNKRKAKAKRKKYYSGKKKQFTIKHQLIANPEKRIFDISDSWPGSFHDKTIFKREKTQEKIPKGARVKLDKGFQGLQKDPDLKDAGFEIFLPKKASRWHKLKRKDKIYNKKLAKERIVIEHVIGGLKFFQILSQRYRHQLENHDRTFKNIAAIWNMKLALAKI